MYLLGQVSAINNFFKHMDQVIELSMDITNDDDWFCHVQLYKNDNGEMVCKTRPVDPYVVELDDDEKTAYSKMRVQQTG